MVFFIIKKECFKTFKYIKGVFKIVSLHFIFEKCAQKQSKKIK